MVGIQKDFAQNQSTGGVKNPPCDTAILKTTSEVAEGCIAFQKERKGDDPSLQERVTVETLEEVGNKLEEKLDKIIEGYTRKQSPIGRLIDRIVSWCESKFGR